MVIAVHGQQGAGKSTICEFLKTQFIYRYIAVKDSFVQYVDYIIDDLQKKTGRTATIEFHKQLSLAISSCGEKYYDDQVWSNITYEKIKSTEKNVAIILDGVRTKMNLDMLNRLANEGETVVFFRLLASEESRKKRVSIWRDNGGYTEQLLEKPESLPSNFFWHDIDTEHWTQSKVEKSIIEKIIPVLGLF